MNEHTMPSTIATLKPLPCPFCGSSDIAVAEALRWRVCVCNCCNAQGPDVKVQMAGSGDKEQWELNAHAGAMAEWNKRALEGI